MRAIVLLSGGLDSTVVLAKAIEAGRECIGIGFDYGQRHKIELEAAQAIADHYGIEFRIIKIDPSVLRDRSALTSQEFLPENRKISEIEHNGIPITYVPGRNTLFLSFAHSLAESLDASEIYFGANVMDHNAYPDCRPAYFEAFNNLFLVASKRAVEGKAPVIVLPLLHMSKKEIVAEGRRLKAPIEQTFSCYNPRSDQPCGICDACVLRMDAFLF